MANPEGSDDIYNGEGDSVTRAYGRGAPDILVGPIDYSALGSVAAIVELNGELSGFEDDDRFDAPCG